MPSELACPNCGAPLRVETIDKPTVRCPFCSTEVVLPEELRPPAEVIVSVIAYPRQAPPRERSGARANLALLMILVLLIAAAVLVPLFLAIGREPALRASLKVDSTATARSAFFNQTAAATATSLPTLTPTPQYAVPALVFGDEGTGEGLFTRASYAAVDGERTLYVADYEGGRVQRFNLSGDYLSQWRFGDSNTFLHGMAATHDGDVYLAYGGVIDRVDGATGKLVYRLSHPEGGEFGDLAVSADGRLMAMWYEGRWGLITSLEGHREELDIFDAEGELLQAIPNLVSAQTESLALDVDLALDGAGAIYALSDSVIFQFSPEGKFIDRINHLGDGPGQFSTANALALDGKGRLFVVDGRDVYVYGAEQNFIDTFASPEYINALTIDREGGIWAVASTRVIRFTLRGGE